MSENVKFHVPAPPEDREVEDFFFGTLYTSTHYGIPRIGTSFLPFAEVLGRHMTAEAYTRHVRRVVAAHGRFRLSAGHSFADIRPLLKLLDPSQIDLAKIYAWTQNYKFFGIELVFPEGLVEVEAAWTFDGNHGAELEHSFLEPLFNSALKGKLILNDGGQLKELSQASMRSALPDPKAGRVRGQSE